MKRSTERILTTHVGSLARSDSLIPLLRLREQGQSYDHREELARLVREAVTDVVRKQVEAGIDIVSDGEQGKSSFYGYVGCAPTEIIDLWDFKNIDQAFVQLVNNVLLDLLRSVQSFLYSSLYGRISGFV